MSNHWWQKCRNLSTSQYFLMKSHHIVSKGQKLKVRQFQALSLSEKKVIKKNPTGGVGLNLLPPPLPPCTIGLNKSLLSILRSIFLFTDDFCLVLQVSLKNLFFKIWKNRVYGIQEIFFLFIWKYKFLNGDFDYRLHFTLF